MNREHCRILSILLLVLSLSSYVLLSIMPPANAQEPDWASIPFPVQSNVYALLSAPNDALFAGSDSGLWASADGGESWTQIVFPFDLVVYSFAAVDPFIFAGTSVGVYVSTDGGVTWQPTELTDFGGLNVWSFAFVDDLLFAGTDRGLFRSADGFTWEPTALTDLNGLNVWSLAALDGVLYAGTDNGIVVSEAVNVQVLAAVGSTPPTSGVNLDVAPQVLGDVWTKSGLFVDAGLTVWTIWATPDEILAGTDQGVFRSLDQGRSWQPAGLKGLDVWVLAPLEGKLYAGANAVYHTTGVPNEWVRAGLDHVAWTFAIQRGFVYVGTDVGIFRAPFSSFLSVPTISILEPAPDQVFPADVQKIPIMVAITNYVGPWSAQLEEIGGPLSFTRTIADGLVLPLLGLKPGTAYTVKVALIDAAGTPLPRQRGDSVQFSIATENHPPLLKRPLPLPAELLIGDELRFTLAASDPDGDRLIYSVDPAPFKPFLNQDTGDFLWRPTDADAGVHVLTFRVADGQGGLDSEAVELAVKAIPGIRILEPADGTVLPAGTSETLLRVVISGFDGAWAATVKSPDGVIPTIKIVRSGNELLIPDLQDGKTYTVSVGLVDLLGNQLEIQKRDEALFAVASAANRPPQFNVVTGFPTEVIVGDQYTIKLTATDPEQELLRYSVLPAPFMPALNVNTGLFTWQPTQADIGEYQLIFRVEDPKGAVDEFPLTLRVLPVPGIRILEPQDGTSFAAGTQEVELVVELIDYSGRWGVLLESAVSVAPDLQIVPGGSVYLLKGLQDGQSYHVTALLVDSSSKPLDRQNRDSVGFSIGQANRPPQLTTQGDLPPTIRVESELSLQLAGDDPEGQDLQYSVLPVRFMPYLDPDIGYFEWTPTDADVGSHTLTFRVQDAAGAFDTLEYTVIVQPIPEIQIIEPAPETVLQAGVGEVLVRVEIRDYDGPWSVELSTFTPEIISKQVVRDTDRVLLTGLQDDTEYELSVQLVQDDGTALEQQFDHSLSFSVAAPNQPPVFDPFGFVPEQVTVGETFSLQLSGWDPDGDAFSFGVSPARFEEDLDSDTGEFAWVPDATDVGEYTITFTIQDEQGGTSEDSISLRVPMPVIQILTPPADESFPGGTTETTLTVDITDYSGPWMAQLEIVGGGQQLEQVVDGGESLRLTELTDGTSYIVTAQLVDANGWPLEKQEKDAVSFVVGVSNQAPVLEPIEDMPDSLIVGDALTLTLRASDPDDDTLTFSMTPDIYAGLLDPKTGAFAWVPEDPDVGTHVFTFRVEDEQGAADTQSLTLRVLPVPAITILEPQDGTLFPGSTEQISLVVQISDHTGPWLAHVEMLNQGVFTDESVWNSKSLLLEGLDSDRTYIVEVSLLDEDEVPLANQIRDSIRFSIERENRAPTLNPINGVPTQVEAGTRIAFQVRGQDADGDRLEYSVQPSRFAAYLNTQTGSFAWTPGDADVGNHTLTFRVTDGEEDSGSRSITLTVTARDTQAPNGTVALSSQGEESGGKMYVGDRDITLRLTASDNRNTSSQIKIALRNGSASWSADETFKSTRAWQLTPGEGEKMVQVRFKDAAGNTSIESLAVWLDTENPKITHQEVDTVQLGQKVRIEAEVNDLSPVEVVLYYRPGGEWDFEEVEMRGGPNFTADIPSGALEHGVSYYVEAEDLLGRTTTYPPSGADDPVGIAASGQFDSPQFGPQIWQLFSLPIQLQGTSVADLLMDALGADAWASESWNGTQNVRGTPNLQPGRPVWLIAKEAFQIQVEGTTATPSDGQEIKLKEGWNLVANPYTFPVAFGNVLLQRDTGDLPLSHPSAAAFVRARFWRWEDTSANDVTDGDYEMLEDFDDEWLPWEGYWMLADADATLLVTPFGELASAAPTLYDVARSTPVWQGMLVAHTEASRNSVRLLLAETAQQRYDQLDIEQPPLPVSNHISLMQQGEAFQQIALDPSGDEWLWEARLIASEPTQITFSGGTLPGYHLYLEDGVSSSRTELSNEGEISFPTGEHALRIRLTRQRLGWDVVGIAPAETQLLPNYPNPFNPETWIPFTLAESGVPQVRIYDLVGHLVREFGLGWLPAGRYTDPGRAVYWDGRDDRGQCVASGTYFYTFHAGDFVATRRLVVLK